MGNESRAYHGLYGFQFIERIELIPLSLLGNQKDGRPALMHIQFNQDSDRGRDFAKLAESCIPEIVKMFCMSGVAEEHIPRDHFIDETKRTLTFFHPEVREGFNGTHYDALYEHLRQMLFVHANITLTKHIAHNSEEHPLFDPHYAHL